MSSYQNTDFFIQLEWDKSTEDLLITWCDHAACFTWVYERSYRKYDNLNNRISVPVIVIGTIVGVLTVGISSLFPPEHVDSVQKVLGGTNILLAIAGTIQNKYRWAQISESHLNAFNEWQKFERNIKIELSIDKKDRIKAVEFIRIMRHDYEKLLNCNPILPLDIIEDFKNKFMFSDLIKPEILDTITHTISYGEQRPVTPISTNSTPSYLKRLASLIPFTKSYKNRAQIFNPSPPKTPRSILRRFEHRSTTPSEAYTHSLYTDEIRKNMLSRDNIVVDTKNLLKDYEDDIVITPLKNQIDESENSSIREVREAQEAQEDLDSIRIHNEET